MFCSNCQEYGHVHRKCQEAITSFGIMCFKEIDGVLKLLLIQRQHSMAYESLIRGRYPKCGGFVEKFITEMTPLELEKIRNDSFEVLWQDLWKGRKTLNKRAMKKFISLRNSGAINEGAGDSEYIFTEFGIPKGRKNSDESNLDCAKREVCEETLLNKWDYNIQYSLGTLTEEFTGSDNNKYRHVYYAAIMKKHTNPPVIDEFNDTQAKEVKSIGMFSLEETMELLRGYNVEKKRCISLGFKNVSKIISDLKEQCEYSINGRKGKIGNVCDKQVF